MKCVVLFGIVIGTIVGCASPNPIDIGNPIEFRHRTAVFTLQVPGGWTQVQDEVPTEALGIFTDPAEQAAITTYVGLLDYRLTDEEGLGIVGRLSSTLLRNPTDYQVTSQRRLPDGAFEVTFEFTRSGQKLTGRSKFRDADLALSGVIIYGPAQDWDRLQIALTPYVESFKIDPEVVQGSYFDILEDTYYILVVPIDWPQQRRRHGTLVQARNQRMSILLVQHDLGRPIGAAELADQAAASLQASFNLIAKVSGSEPLPDGRLKVTLERGDQRIVGFVEQFDTHLVGLFFDMPADRVEDYQPFMDFVYSTYISRLP